MDLLVYIKTDSGAIDNGGSSHSINFLRSVPTCECVCSHARVFSNKHSRTGHTLYLSTHTHTHTHIFVLSWFKPRTCWPYREKGPRAFLCAYVYVRVLVRIYHRILSRIAWAHKKDTTLHRWQLCICTRLPYYIDCTIYNDLQRVLDQVHTMAETWAHLMYCVSHIIINTWTR